MAIDYGRALEERRQQPQQPEIQNDYGQMLAERRGLVDTLAAEGIQPAPDVIAEEIVQQRDQGGFPQKGSGIADIFTGKKRSTKATRELPELGGDIGVKQFLGEGATDDQVNAVTFGLTVTPDPIEFLKILHANSPGKVNVRSDEAGNLLVSVDGGQEAVLNKPGVSKIDMLQLAGLSTLYYPAGRAAVGAKSLTSAAGRAAGGAAVTQGAIEAAQTGIGGEFDPGEVGAAALFSAGSEAGFALLRPVAGQIRNLLRRTDGTITDEVRQQVFDAAIRTGIDPATLNDDIITQLARQADEAVTPQSMAVQGEDEFGISLTKGERSLDQRQLSFEDRARSGQLGGGAQNVFSEFDAQRGQDIRRAVGGTQQNLAGRSPLISTQQEAAALTKQGVRAAEQTERAVYQQAFDEIGDAKLTPEGVTQLLNATRKAVIGIDKDRGLKSTAKTLQVIQGIQRRTTQLEKGGLKPSGRHIQELNLLRRRLNGAIDSAEDATDKRQMVLMKRAFDDKLDDAVINSLFEGDEGALGALRSANDLFREYAQKFRANPRYSKSGNVVDSDQAGRFIEKIIEANPTDQETLNALFGASNFSNQAGFKMAERFRSILGRDSPEWGAIRQAAFQRLIKTNSVNGRDVVSGQKTLQAVNKAFTENRELMSTLFDAEERGAILRLAAQIKRTEPDIKRSRENPSGTAQALIKSLGDRINQATKLLGIASGSPLLFITGQGVEVGQGLTRAAKARDAVRPFSRFQAAPGGVVGGATATGRLALPALGAPANGQTATETTPDERRTPQ